MESTIRWSAPSSALVGEGTSMSLFRRDSVVWSGAFRSSSINRSNERRNPSVGAKVKNHAQRQRRHDCQIRAARLANAAAVLRWFPSFARLLGKPNGDVATAPGATLVLLLPPVGHAILRLVFAVHSGGLARGHGFISSIFDVSRSSVEAVAGVKSYSRTKATEPHKLSTSQGSRGATLASRDPVKVTAGQSLPSGTGGGNRTRTPCGRGL